MILCANPSAQFASYQDEIEAAVLTVMRGNWYVLGESVSALEKSFAEFSETDHAIAVANGTDALELALRALDIGYGDEVITVSHTAVATVAAIEAAGATSVLVDVEKDFYTLDPTQLEQVVSEKTKAVIAVHLYGQPADLDSISQFCQQHKLPLIEDGSQAHGAKWKGKTVGSIGDIGCFSCYPTKNLGAIGDAGLVTTNNSDLAKKVRMLREYGWKDRLSQFPGRNSRMDELQAAILNVKLKYLNQDNEKRRQIASFYKEQLQQFVQIPQIRSEAESVFHLFVVQVEAQQDLCAFLRAQSVQAGIHYPAAVHQQPAYQNRVKTAKNMDVTENLVQHIVSLPIYPELTMEHTQTVVTAVKQFFNQ